MYREERSTALDSARLHVNHWRPPLEALTRIGQCLHFEYLTAVLVPIMEHVFSKISNPFCNLDMALPEMNIICQLHLSF